MSSGIRFNEQYDGRDDLSALIEDTIGHNSPGGTAPLLRYQERRVEPGRMFYYSSADTQALGLVVRGATGMPIADYLSARIWQPMGAQDDASFLVDTAGQQATFAFFHATLADFGRLGMLLANDGRADGEQLIPAAWIRQATTGPQNSSEVSWSAERSRSANPAFTPGSETPPVGNSCPVLLTFWTYRRV